MANTPPNTSLSTSNNNESDCADELQVAETSHQSNSLEVRTITPALSTGPITTEVKAVETDPDTPAESLTSIDSEATLDANLELMCSLEEVRSITPGPYWFRPIITPETVEEHPYDDDDREVAFIFGLDDETVRRRQKRRRFLSVVRSAVRRAFRAVCCGCVKPDFRDID